MSLFMHAFQPDVAQLMRFASRERLLPPGGDVGYALHSTLAGAFGEFAPKPFVWCAPGTRTGGTGGRLLCYSHTPMVELQAHASSYGQPGCVSVLDLLAAGTKSMPQSFSPGARLGFRVRLRPVLRTGRNRDGSGGKERDAYIDGASGSEHEYGRSTCYLEWLEARVLAGGARMERGSLDSFTLTRLMTRDRSGDKSRRSSPTGPDALASGVLSVTDAEAFATMLARGIGRFRAFGFGMLLLTPAASVPH